MIDTGNNESQNPASSEEADADGTFLDMKGRTWSPTHKPKELIYLPPNNGEPVVDRVLFVNGIMTDVALHFSDMQALANTGAEVLGIHNSTYGLWRDVKQCAYDLLNKGLNPAEQTTRRVIQASIESREELHLVGHSQGAIIISRALRNVVIELKKAGISRERIPDMLSHLKVETYGGGAAHFTDGPQYVHVDNWLDPIPFHAGLGMSSRLLNQNSHPGRGAVQYTFFQLNNPWKGKARKIRAKKSARKAEEMARFVDYMIHGPQDIYFPQRKSFAAMRAGEYSSTEKSFIQKH